MPTSKPYAQVVTDNVIRLVAPNIYDAERRQKLAKMYRQLLLEDPENINLLLELANVYMLDRNFDAAKECYIRAMNIDPKNALTHFGIGWVHEELGKTFKAAEKYRKAIELDPSFLEARYNLARLAPKLGEYWEAAIHWDSYMRSVPGDLGAKKDHQTAIRRCRRIHLLT